MGPFTVYVQKEKATNRKLVLWPNADDAPYKYKTYIGLFNTKI